MGLPFSPPGYRDEKNPVNCEFPAVESFYLGPLALPGKWTVTATREWKWGIQPAQNLDGATYSSVATPPAKVEAVGLFWRDDQWAFFKRFAREFIKSPALVLGPPGVPLSPSAPIPQAPAFAISIWHPETARLGIESVLIERVGSLNRVDETGLWQIRLEMVEWRVARQVLAGKIVAKIPDIAPTVPSALTAAQIEQQKATAAIDARKAALK
jgi:hypothetical protein